MGRKVLYSPGSSAGLALRVNPRVRSHAGSRGHTHPRPRRAGDSLAVGFGNYLKNALFRSVRFRRYQTVKTGGGSSANLGFPQRCGHERGVVAEPNVDRQQSHQKSWGNVTRPTYTSPPYTYTRFRLHIFLRISPLFLYFSIVCLGGFVCVCV